MTVLSSGRLFWVGLGMMSLGALILWGFAASLLLIGAIIFCASFVCKSIENSEEIEKEEGWHATSTYRGPSAAGQR